MQDEQRHMHNEDKIGAGTNNDVPANVEKLLTYLGEVWQRLHEPSADDLQQVTQFIMALPEPYRTQGLQTIVRHLTSYMSLHLLKLMTTFQQKAEAEGIDAGEVAATFADLLPESFQMLELCTHIAVHSIDDLIDLTNITVGLAGLSRVDTAERAQHWMYTLPHIYVNQIKEENFVEEGVASQQKEVLPSANFTDIDSASVDFTFTLPARAASTKREQQRDLAMPRLKILSSVA